MHNHVLRSFSVLHASSLLASSQRKMGSSARLHAEEFELSHSRMLFKRNIAKRPSTEWLYALLPQPPPGKGSMHRVAAVSAAAGASRSREVSTARAHCSPCSLTPTGTGRGQGRAGTACLQLQARLESTRQARPYQSLGKGYAVRLTGVMYSPHLATIATKSACAGLVEIKQMVICTSLAQHLVKLYSYTLEHFMQGHCLYQTEKHLELC
jgi:hypothetical protein